MRLRKGEAVTPATSADSVISELLTRLRAHGFATGEGRRALAALAGARVPTLPRVRAERQTATAAELLAEGRPAAEVAKVLRQRYGISRASAYRRIAAAVSTFPPPETTDCHDEG